MEFYRDPLVLEKEKKKPRSMARSFLIFLGFMLVLLIIMGTGLFFLKYQTVRTAWQVWREGRIGSEQEVANLVRMVGKKVVLPKGTPTVATVTDPTLPRDQAFFSQAQKGDRVLIFLDAKKVILYRPSSDLVVDVANYNPSGESQTLLVPNPVIEASSSAEFTVALYNGSPTAGITTRYETELSAALPNAEVVFKDTATKRDYTQSFIVDVTGTQGTLVQMISEKLQLPVQSLPADETAPNAQVLIILGSDKK